MIKSYYSLAPRTKVQGASKKNFLLPNLALANIAVDGEKSNNTVLTNSYSVVGLVCPRSEEQISEPIAV